MSATFLVDGKTALNYQQSIHATIASDTTTNGAAVDLTNAEGPVNMLYSIGNAGDASTAYTIKIQEADASGGTYSDIAGASVAVAASASANDNTTGMILTQYRAKRFVRAVVVTSGGGTVSVPIACVFLSRKKISGTGTGTQL